MMEKENKEYKEIGCRDVGLSCDFKVRAESEEEILNRCSAHACDSHGKCGDSPEVKERIRNQIKTVSL